MGVRTGDEINDRLRIIGGDDDIFDRANHAVLRCLAKDRQGVEIILRF